MIKIGNKIISYDRPTYIIAEAGVNHNGSVKLAKKMIDIAVEAEVDAIKFQTFKTEKVVTRFSPKANYQLSNTDYQETQYEMLKKLELSDKSFYELKEYCNKKGIHFLSSPFDEESVDLLSKLGIDAYKIGSGEITNLPFLSYIAKEKKPIILSTGMSNLAEIEEALEVFKGNDVILLHATSNYPTSFEDVNLMAMKTIETAFNKIIGYSDHTEGIEVAVAAVAMGAKVIEKHFTIDKSLNGPDHKASLTPEELKALVKAIRNLEKSLGSGIKRAMFSEENTKLIARKSVVSKDSIKGGTVLSEDMLLIKRPGNGIAPKYKDMLIGKTLKKSVSAEEVLHWEHFI